MLQQTQTQIVQASLSLFSSLFPVCSSSFFFYLSLCSSCCTTTLMQLVNFELTVALPPYHSVSFISWRLGGSQGGKNAKSDFWHPPPRTYLCSDPVYLSCLEKQSVNLGLLQPSKHFGLFVVFFSHSCFGSDLGWGCHFQAFLFWYHGKSMAKLFRFQTPTPQFPNCMTLAK